MAAKGIPLYRRDGTIRAFTMVDGGAFEQHGVYRWCLREQGANFYVQRLVPLPDGRTQRRYLHREIVGLEPGDPLRVDHINRDTLDNRRSNLRICTDAENAQNVPGRPDSMSKYRGVTWRSDKQKWKVTHRMGGRTYTAGLFEDEDEAGRVAADWRADHMPFSQEYMERHGFQLTLVQPRKDTLTIVAQGAIRPARTHCKHGHELTPENTYVYPRTGYRSCRVCIRAALERSAQRSAA